MTAASLRLGLALGLAALAVAGAVPAHAQDRYPSRPIEFIVPWGPGGGADQVARKLGKLMEPELKVSIPVVNVPGATGTTGLQKLLSAQPDGYTISVMTGDTFGLLASGQQLRWKLSDLVPLGIVIRQPSGFFVKADSKYRTWDDLAADAKARPGQIKVAVTGFGSPDDMTVNFIAGKGVRMTSVPFANPGERYASILGGHADLLYEQAGDVKSFIDSKQMRPLVFFAPARMPEFPDVAASKELGYEVYLPQMRMIIVKAGTDAAIVKTLSEAVAKAARNPEYDEYLKGQLAQRDSFIPADRAGAFLEESLKELQSAAALLKK